MPGGGSFAAATSLFLPLLALTLPSHALEVIVDNHDATCTTSGAWTVATTNCYGPDKYMHTAGSGTDRMVWTAALPAGWYRVDFRINSNTGYTTAAQYAVTHRDGTANKTVTQRRGSSGWYALSGAHYFDGAATVTLTDNFPASTGSSVVADAIRFQSVFSFVHMSDSHFGYGPGNTQAGQIANELKTPSQYTMATYGFDAPPPSFAIHTGDLTEYGEEYWNTAITAFSVLPFAWHTVMGNHDATWACTREKIRARQGAAFRSFDFDYLGTRHHFVLMNSPIIQTPRAAFAREELDWLAADLAAVGTTVPVFLAFHHPIDGASDPKPYDTYRLLDLLRPYNAQIIYYGHGHSATQEVFDGIRIVQGGSTYSDSAGVGCYNLNTVSHNRIHIAKKTYGEPTADTGILNNMTMAAASAYPAIAVVSPVKNNIYTASSVSVNASIASTVTTTVATAKYELDGDANWRTMTGSGYGPYAATLSMAGLVHGRHWVRVEFTMSNGDLWHQTVPFWHWDGEPKANWIVDLGASSLSAPAVADGRVFVGANGGLFLCVDANTGSEVWRANFPGDIVSSPVVADGRVVFGCSDGKVYCLASATGAPVWTATVSGPVYGSPTSDAGAVYIGTIGTGAANSAKMYSLNAATGAANWSFAANNAIETKPCVLNGAVFFGAWGANFYAVNTSNGTQKWVYQRNSNRYYSPADSWPAASAASNRVFVADREYYMNAIDIATGAQAWTAMGVSSQGVLPDGTGLLMRLSSAGTLSRVNFDNTAAAWSAACSLDSAAVAPQSVGARAGIVDQDGLASVLNVANGAILYQFQTSRSYELHPVTIDETGRLFASTYEGFLLGARNAPAGVDDWMAAGGE